MQHSTRPELDREVGADEHCSDSISDSLMASFNRFLSGSVRSSGVHFTTTFLEHLLDLWASMQFPSLVQCHKLILAFNRSMDLQEPNMKTKRENGNNDGQQGRTCNATDVNCMDMEDPSVCHSIECVGA